ncbi:MAG: membrane protein insertion efficiency factor YidD [Parcubacteria group bacterium RIFCSPLOWO2_01_FULL_40_65]|nr:MAG: membrane protein insertion efficiency factor YidD [Parcubacteria group bacterium RIFCSPHIGHO2_01_FULL_40_30]OHB19372.1 MAG: membrane protein insertion efficiency factor YidD [Parcubacteria group bacterium RIFCSPHIGHO2_02_FULL_40_12]OHB21256.1 MAG: membrane protein insertion efficiency factor YidD [Parcubacteria group bacterium RIFCSPLOWO2_01_FULL_40_65]OHB23552.1 MAG: membrane protein insertion efficiency factor YidD [Parcubacteria group bacterium RIFCSPLOWO2_02_FULL_40_12]OHB24322.1 MA
MGELVIKLIRLYQKTLSPNYGLIFLNSSIGCRFYPSCSEYSISAINKYGFFGGLEKSLIRILKCGPWSKGGVDFPN